MWMPDRRAELAQGLASLGTLFEQVDELLSDPACQDVLSTGAIAAVDAPRLGLSRHRTNVLCAKALVELDGPGGSHAGAKRLGQALDMIRLGDDGRLFGCVVSNAEECIVLQALQRMLLCPDGDVSAMNAVLGGRLDRIARDHRAETALSCDLADFQGRSRPLAERGWIAPWRGIGELMERRRLGELLGGVIPARAGAESGVQEEPRSVRRSRRLHERAIAAEPRERFARLPHPSRARSRGSGSRGTVEESGRTLDLLPVPRRGSGRPRRAPRGGCARGSRREARRSRGLPPLLDDPALAPANSSAPR